MLTVAAVFLFIGSMTQMAFAESGIMLVLGALAASMLPFRLMGGNALWRWKKPAGIASAAVGLVPYTLFLYGMLPYNTVYIMGVVGFVVFASIMIADIFIVKGEEKKTTAVPATPAPASPNPAATAAPAAAPSAGAVTPAPEAPAAGSAPAIAPIAPTAQVAVSPDPAAQAASNDNAPPAAPEKQPEKQT
jgi:hypothetical protein